MNASLDAPTVDAFSLDMGVDDWDMILNPKAAPFFPPWAIDGVRAKRVDEAMALFHHLSTVSDSDTLADARAWLGPDESDWAANGAEYIASEAEAEFEADLRAEQRLCDQLYKPPRQPKGDRSGRARKKQQRCPQYR